MANTASFKDLISAKKRRQISLTYVLWITFFLSSV